MAFYEFDGIHFGAVAQEQQPVVSPPESLYSVRHIPYSNRVVLDLGGKGARYYRSRIRVAPFNVAFIEAALHTTASLTVAAAVYPSATLTKLENKAQTPRGEYYFYDAEFLIG